MKSTIELIKPWQGGVVAFFMTFLIILGLGTIMDKRMDYLLFSALFIGIMFGIMTFGIMYRKRSWTIIISFTDKKDFMKKLDMLLFQMNFGLESNRENFLIYKINALGGMDRIAVTLNQKDATIVGAKYYVERLQKSF